MLGVDLVRMSWDKQIDKAIIVTADSDFNYAIKSAKDAGVIVNLLYYDGKGYWNLNNSLIEECDQATKFTNDFLDECKR